MTARFAFAALLALLIYGCTSTDNPRPTDPFAGMPSRDNVRITDAVTGKPIVGATVVAIFPSFTGGTYTTNANGVVHIDAFPRFGYGVGVTVPGYDRYSFNTHGTTDHPGWHDDNLFVAMRPLPVRL